MIKLTREREQQSVIASEAKQSRRLLRPCLGTPPRNDFGVKNEMAL